MRGHTGILTGILVLGLGLAASACGSSSSPGTAPASSATSSASAAGCTSSGAPVKVGFIYELTGYVPAFAQQEEQGFKAGLDYATKGTDAVCGHPIQVTYQDDGDSAATAVSDAKADIGQGYKILVGSVVSAIALQLASIAAQIQVLYIAGPAADDGITGINRYTFRAGRETYQDVLTAQAILGGQVSGKKVVVLAQNSAFGQSNFAAVKQVMGGAGASVSSVLVPLTATDLTPYAVQVSQAHPDLLFVAWAGANEPALFNALNTQGVLDSTKVITGLAHIVTYPFYGTGVSKLDFLSLYFYQCCTNAANTALANYVQANPIPQTPPITVPDLFDADGFVLAQMIVRAVDTSGGDSNVNTMISQLEGYSFLAPKGQETIRAADHAMLQPEFIAKLQVSGSGSTATYTPQLVQTITPQQVAPPVVQMGHPIA